MRRLFKLGQLFALVVMLAGCMQTANAPDQLVSDIDKCIKGKMTRKNAVERRTCLDAASMSAARRESYPNIWILDLLAASNKKAAIAYANGRTTKEEFDAQIEENQANAVKTEKELPASNASVEAESSRSRAYKIPFYPMETRRRTQTSCNMIGNYMNCTTY